jgi:hypothetical protein
MTEGYVKIKDRGIRRCSVEWAVSRNTGNIGHKAQNEDKNKTRNTTQKAKKMSDTDSVQIFRW